jgi:hypothetical protein
VPLAAAAELIVDRLVPVEQPDGVSPRLTVEGNSHHPVVGLQEVGLRHARHVRIGNRRDAVLGRAARQDLVAWNGKVVGIELIEIGGWHAVRVRTESGELTTSVSQGPDQIPVLRHTDDQQHARQSSCRSSQNYAVHELSPRRCRPSAGSLPVRRTKASIKFVVESRYTLRRMHKKRTIAAQLDTLAVLCFPRCAS